MGQHGTADADVDLLDKGFTISDALKKKVLSEIKFLDLTIGDLVKGLAAAPPASAAEEPSAAASEEKPVPDFAERPSEDLRTT